MNIFTAKSDLDLSINFDNGNAKCLSRNQVISILRRVAKSLRRKQSKGHLSGVLPILSAKVPVLKAVDCKTGIECDISVENKDGISRSLFFSIISLIDERFRIISFLMKAWAKANDINSSKDHTLNSLSIISLVALHFQTRDPPILPPFSTLLRDGTDLTKLHRVVPEFENLAKRNRESVAELFVALLTKLTSVEKMWEHGLCASNFEGSWISKTWTSKISSNMNVEDFLDRDQNFARSVGKSEMPKIYGCLRRSLGYLRSSMQDQIGMPALRTLLFGLVALDTQTSHASTYATAAINLKLPIKPIHPSADVVDESSRALLQKQTSNEFVLKLPIKPIRTSVRTKTATQTSLKRKQISTKSTALLAGDTSINTGTTLKTKPPVRRNHITNDSPMRTHVRNDPPKRPRYNKAAGELPPGYLPSPNNIYFSRPMMHPAPSYSLPPQNTSAHQLPPQHLLLHHHGHMPQHRPMAPESSGMFRYYSNPVLPPILDGRHNPSMLPGYTTNAVYPHFFVPQSRGNY
ncbi:hypothetical protein KSP40_PGU002304 [Platanthera guangdongensis]|uniref:Poly(A) RNA polymerase mitochondrial-like central palm domain-containing protein n=1 Tax=Platanthera guangdongensis TaxID=2320717 RepID=A0ABR2MW49_9ASPA